MYECLCTKPGSNVRIVPNFDPSPLFRRVEPERFGIPKRKLFVKILNLCIFVASIKHICKEYHKRICTLEGEKIDYEYEVARKALEARIDFLILL